MLARRTHFHLPPAPPTARESSSQSADGVARFAAVAEALGRGGDVAGVARDALRLAQLGELLLGRDAPRPRPRGAARLPADVFASPGEALTVALRAVGGVGYNLAGSEAADFAADRAARTAGGAALKAAYDAAAAAGLVTGPKVVFDESLPAGSLPKLKELVASLGGTVAGSAEGATHLLATDPPPRGAMPDETYGRVAGAIECASGAAIWRVHWMYTPDSHDEWVTEVRQRDACWRARRCWNGSRSLDQIALVQHCVYGAIPRARRTHCPQMQSDVAGLAAWMQCRMPMPTPRWEAG